MRSKRGLLLLVLWCVCLTGCASFHEKSQGFWEKVGYIDEWIQENLW